MDRRQYLTALGAAGATAVAGCSGAETPTPLKVANRRDGEISFRLTRTRIGDSGADCEADAPEPTTVAETTLASGDAETYTTLTEPGTFRFGLALGDATHTGCGVHDGPEREYVYVVSDEVRFVEREPGVNGPF